VQGELPKRVMMKRAYAPEKLNDDWSRARPKKKKAGG